MRERLVQASARASGAFGLVALAIANAAGYRYGVADQAFYIPSILHAVDPGRYPRDAALLDAQGQLMVTDELTASLVTGLGWRLEPLLLAAHVLSLLLLFGAVWALARRMSTSRWTAAACCLAVTLRHRITETGANSFEGYYHPRELAFATGAWAVVALASNQRAWAWTFVAIAALLHPTTGIWWALLVGTAAVVLGGRTERRAVALAAGVAALLAAALALSPIAQERLQVMDAAWIRPFASKDYVFPTAWPLAAWIANLVLPVVVVGVWRWRVRRGIAARWEAGVSAGALVLTATFLASLPFIAMRVALAVQLQTSRVFWVIDLFAVLAAVWALAEGVRPDAGVAAAARSPRGTWRVRRPVLVAGLLLVVSASRGLYVTRVEHPERAFVQVGLVDSDWVRVGRWLATRTPPDTHVLADPDHDWKFGHSVRVTAHRDVLVEGVKDAAVSLYDRDVALRVQARLEAIGDFDTLDVRRAVTLADRFDLDVLVIDRDLPLRQLHREGRFRVYGLN